MAMAPGRLSVARYLFQSARGPFTLVLHVWVSVFVAETCLSALWLVNVVCILLIKFKRGKKMNHLLFFHLICELFV